MSDSIPAVNAHVDNVFDALRPFVAELLTKHKREYGTEHHSLSITLRPTLHQTARPGKDIAIEVEQSSTRVGPITLRSTRGEMIDELLAIAAGTSIGKFGIDNLPPGFHGGRIIQRGLDSEDFHLERSVLRYRTPDALVTEWLLGLMPEVPFELRALDWEPVLPETHARRWPSLESHERNDFPPRADSDDERIKLLFGIYGLHRRPGVLDSVFINGKDIPIVRYDCEEDRIAEWRMGKHPDIPFALRFSAKERSMMYRIKQPRPPRVHGNHCVYPSDYPARGLPEHLVPECPTPALRRLFASEVQNHIGKPWARRLGHVRELDGRKSLVYTMDKARLHDWLLGIHPHVPWVGRLVVAEVPPRSTGKRRREADEEEEAPSRKRSRREDEIADDEDEATDGDSEPVSPPTSPPPSSLQIPSIRRRPTNPWDSPAPHLRLRPVPSSFRAPATRVIDPTLSYTPPVLAREPHPRPNTSIESPSPSSSSSSTPTPRPRQPSAQILTRVIDPSKESPSDKALRMATITLANGAGGQSRRYIDGEKLHRLSAQFREEEETEQKRMRRVQWKGFSYCNGGASVPPTPTPSESSKCRRDEDGDVEPEEDMDATQPCKKVRFASLPAGTTGNFRPRKIRLSRIALS